MSDAQFDGGDNGQAAEDFVGDFIGDKDPAGAVRWYGFFALANAFGSILVYMLLNGNWWVAQYKDGFSTRTFFYMPVAMSWLAVSFFDSPFMRKIFGEIIAISILCPFFWLWYVFGQFLLYSDGKYSEFWTWASAAIWFSWNVFESVVQIVLLPTVFEWTEADLNTDFVSDRNPTGPRLLSLFDF